MSSEAESTQEANAPAQKALWGWWVPVVLAALLTFMCAYWIGIGRVGLGQVSLTRVDRMYKTESSMVSRAVLAVVTAAGLALFTGYRRRRAGQVDGVALLGGAWVLGWVAFFASILSGLELSGPQYKCLYPSCWPRGYQGLAIATPIIVAVLVMAVMATLGRRAPWWVRAALPAVVFVVLTIVQAAIWDSAVIPFFDRPPPF